MTTVLLLAFPGFVAIYIYRWFARSRSKVGWDFLVITGLAGSVSYVLGFVLYRAWSQEIITDIFAQLENSLSSPSIEPAPYLLSFAVAPFLAMFAWTVFYSDSFTAFLVNGLSARHPPGKTDILSNLESADPQRPVIVSLDNDQVYVGFVHAVTTDPDESLKLLVLSLVLSGTRTTIRGKRKVVYNYALEFVPERPNHIYLDFRNVISVALFDIETFFISVAASYSIVPKQALAQFMSSLVNSGFTTAEELDRFV